MDKLRGPAALSPKQKGFAVAALAAMLAPSLIVGTKLVDWVNLSKHNDIAVSLGPADVFNALRRDPSELGAGGRLPLSEELSAALLADLEDGDLDTLDNDPGVIDDFPGEHGIPGVVLEAYLRAEDKMAQLVPGCNLDWALLAGIGKVESNHASNGRVNAVGDATPKILGPVLNGAPGMAAIHDTDGGRLDGDKAWDRAVGPMQFIPATWASFGGDGNEDGNVNPNNVYDAALGAGRYLCAGGGDLTKQSDRAAAVFRYNQSTTYVQTVLKWAKEYSDNVDSLPLLPSLPNDGNNQQNPTPGNPSTPPGGDPGGNPGTSNPPSSTPPSSTPPNCPTTTPPPSSTTTSSTPTSTSTSCPPSSTPPSSSTTTTTTTTTTSSNPPQTEPSTPPASEPSSGTSQSSVNTTTSSVQNESSVQPTSNSLVTTTPS